MTIEVRTRTFYYCTECDYEYDEEDKKNGQVCIFCTNHPELEGCDDCLYKCDKVQHLDIWSGLQGCDFYYCVDCVKSTPFDAVYPGLLCVNCIKKHGLEKYYGEAGFIMAEEMDQMKGSQEQINKQYFPGLYH